MCIFSAKNNSHKIERFTEYRSMRNKVFVEIANGDEKKKRFSHQAIRKLGNGLLCGGLSRQSSTAEKYDRATKGWIRPCHALVFELLLPHPRRPDMRHDLYIDIHRYVPTFLLSYYRLFVTGRTHAWIRTLRAHSRGHTFLLSLSLSLFVFTFSSRPYPLYVRAQGHIHRANNVFVE